MTFPEIDPVIFQIGPLALRWYALAYLAGILLGWLYAGRLAANTALWGPRAPVATKDQIEDILLWVVLGVIVGGRLGYMLFYNTEAIWKSPLDIVKIWQGGMSFHGGLIGVALAFLWVARLQKLDLLKVSDLVAPAIPIGLFFGRIANFVNAELWGRETYSPFGMVFCNDTVREYNNGACPAGLDARHPSQLYEAGLEGLLLFAILWVAVFKLGLLKRRGAVTGLFLVGYSIFRMLVENVREPDAGLEGWPFGLTMGIVLSLPMLLGGLWLLFGVKNQPEPAPLPKVAAPPPASEPTVAKQAAPKAAVKTSAAKTKPKPKPAK